MPGLKHATTPVLNVEDAVRRREARTAQIHETLKLTLPSARRDELHAELIRVSAEIDRLQQEPSRAPRTAVIRHFLPDQTSDWLRDARDGNAVTAEVGA
jgi:hypothetical protein